jgi:hypothetical protein
VPGPLLGRFAGPPCVATPNSTPGGDAADSLLTSRLFPASDPLYSPDLSKTQQIPDTQRRKLPKSDFRHGFSCKEPLTSLQDTLAMRLLCWLGTPPVTDAGLSDDEPRHSRIVAELLP